VRFGAERDSPTSNTNTNNTSALTANTLAPSSPAYLDGASASLSPGREKGERDSSSLSTSELSQQQQQPAAERMFTYYFAQELEREKFAHLSGASSAPSTALQSLHAHFVFHDARARVMSLGAGSGPITNYTVISALVVEGVSLG
jgi:hypothetical protein